MAFDALLSPSAKARITRFAAYEDREEAFRAQLGALVPRMHLGPGVFWRDINRISFSRVPSDTAWITSNPADCLAFGTARQVLAAACLKAGPDGQDPGNRIKETARAFDLEANLDQPVATLSGGETVKLALAKAFVAASASRRLVIASPFSWLSQDNGALFARLLDHCSHQHCKVDVLALVGEDNPAPVPAPELGPLGFDLVVDDLTLALGPGFGLLAPPVRVAVTGLRLSLASPCLLSGANGQGKSLMAKVLAGAVACRGQARFVSRRCQGRARLLFQDVLHQGLMRGLGEIARSAGRPHRDRAMTIYEAIATGSPGRPDRPAAPSLLAVKRMLAAVRLAAGPAALILDEPDWGLSRDDALAFVQAVVAAAHDQGVPVVMISHKPWWTLMAASRVAVRRTPLAASGSASGFQICLQ
jgi:putative thiamine transport system ATP-binding protein